MFWLSCPEPGRDWWTLSIAVATIIATAAGVYWKDRREWLLHSADLVSTLLDRFEAPLLANARCNLATLCESRHQGRQIDIDGDRVLSFFEHLGYLVRRGALDETMVANKFGWQVIGYHYALTRGAMGPIDVLRSETGTPSLYTEFDGLAKRMERIFEDERSTLYREGQLVWFARFIQEEKQAADFLVRASQSG